MSNDGPFPLRVLLKKWCTKYVKVWLDGLAMPAVDRLRDGWPGLTVFCIQPQSVLRDCSSTNLQQAASSQLPDSSYSNSSTRNNCMMTHGG